MSKVKTIDVRGLAHIEREKLLFPSIESLEDDEMLRLVIEFNPVPLVFMLKAQGEFKISYEKDGPEEWILNVARIVPKDELKASLKRLFKELKSEKVSEETREKAKKLLKDVDARTLSVLEQELMNEGVSKEDVRRSLCDIHLEAMRDNLVSKRIDVEAPHPVHTFMEEHRVILNSLEELGSLVERLKGRAVLEEGSLEELQDISHHLVEAESHHQREEDVLFPRLEDHGIVEPSEIMKMDHVEFRARKKELYQLAHNPQDYDAEEFRRKVIELGNYLAKELKSHIFKEDNIIYQIALQELAPEEWNRVKKDCDKIGYCCFTPEDQGK